MKRISVSIIIFILIASTINYAQPYQFIAKVWSEALGRIPDPTSWHTEESNIVNSFYYYQNIVRAVYKSSEFKNNYPTTDTQWCEARLLALYRGALNREPDQYGFNSYITYINERHDIDNISWEQAWQEVVDGITNGTPTSAFYILVTGTIISGATNGLPYYGWGTNPTIEVVAPTSLSRYSSTAFNGNQTELQSILDSVGVTASVSNQKVVSLAPMARILLNSTLTIPSFVTLTTSGFPTPTKYAKMARFVKSTTINDDMIKLKENSIIRNIWIDGSYGRIPKDIASNSDVSCINNVGNSNGLKILYNRLDNASGTNFIKVHATDGRNCNNAEVRNNLITAYSTLHMDATEAWKNPPRAEGIDIDMLTYGIIEYNQIIDITDGGICLFSPWSTGSFNVQIQYNQILNAGNSAVAGIVFDPEHIEKPTDVDDTHIYTGAQVHDNNIWTSPSAHIDYPLHIGCYSEYYNHYGLTTADIGTGGSFTSNTSGVNSINAEIGVMVDGFSGITIQNNTLNFRKGEAYHSRLNRTYARFSTISSGSIDSQYPMSFYDYNPYLGNGDINKKFYIEGPDTVYANQTYYFYLRTQSESVFPSTHNWYVYTIGGSQIQSPISQTSFSINTSEARYKQDLWIRCQTGVEGDESKFVTYKYSALSKNSGQKTTDNLTDIFDYKLENNYPNPFNPSSKIAYSLKEDGWVQLSIFNLLGQKVIDLVNKNQNAGQYEVTLDGSKLPSGVYIYRIQCNGFSDSKKLILMK